MALTTIKYKTRYQACTWYEKVWRWRHYVGVPYQTLQLWAASRWSDDPLSLALCYSLSKGLAQVNMNWVYNWEDIKKRLEQDDN